MKKSVDYTKLCLSNVTSEWVSDRAFRGKKKHPWRGRQGRFIREAELVLDFEE